MAVSAVDPGARVALGDAFLGRIPGGTFRLFSNSANSANNYVSSHALGGPAGTVANNGQVQMAAIGLNASAINAGAISHGVFFNAAGTGQWRCNVSNAAGAGIDFVMTPSNVAVVGAPIGIGLLVFNIANI